MAKVQTRRSVSLSRHAYEALQLFAAERGMSGSAVTAALAAFMGVKLEAIASADLRTVQLGAEMALREVFESLGVGLAQRDLKPENSLYVVLSKLTNELERRSLILEKDDELSQTMALTLREIVESILVAVKP